MIALTSLWLPILLGTVAVQILSTIAWVLSPHHKSDFDKLSDEDGFLQNARAHNLSRGQYFFPYAMGPEASKDPVIAEKFKTGPVGLLTIFEPGMPNMALKSAQSFVFYLIVTITAAYVATRTLSPGTDYLSVFRISSTVAFVAYAGGAFPEAIWFGMPWKRAWKTMIDGLVYATVTGGILGWLWP